MTEVKHEYEFRLIDPEDNDGDRFMEVITAKSYDEIEAIITTACDEWYKLWQNDEDTMYEYEYIREKLNNTPDTKADIINVNDIYMR